jgi:hypothetical protein
MANGVAKWNGTTWASLGASNNNGVGGTALALAVLGSSVYVGGNFTTASGISANRIAKWDGTSWSNLRTGTTGNGFGGPGTSVSALAVLGNDLYEVISLARWALGPTTWLSGTALTGAVSRALMVATA